MVRCLDDRDPARHPLEVPRPVGIALDDVPDLGREPRPHDEGVGSPEVLVSAEMRGLLGSLKIGRDALEGWDGSARKARTVWWPGGKARSGRIRISMTVIIETTDSDHRDHGRIAARGERQCVSRLHPYQVDAASTTPATAGPLVVGVGRTRPSAAGSPSSSSPWPRASSSARRPLSTPMIRRGDSVSTASGLSA